MKVRKIETGACFGIVCPSGCHKDAKRVEAYLEYLTKLGFKYKIGDSVHAQEGYLAGSDIIRATDINNFFKDDEVDAILCYRGGYGAGRMLDLIDFDAIKQNPKLLVGFSDVTVLLNTIYKFANLPSLHGEMGVVFKEHFYEEKEFSFDNLHKTLLGEAPRNLLEGFTNVEFVNDGEIIAPIVGGNLTLICNLMGTPYEIDFQDKILFIEEVDEQPYAIDRYLCQLKNAGVFKKVKAIIFGYFTGCEPEREGIQTVEEVLYNYTKDLTCPIIMNFPSGHDRPFVNIPIGVNVKLNTKEKSVIVLESLFFDK